MKNVLVTGAGSGIGLEIVTSLLKEGYYVIAHYNRSKKNLLKLSKSYENLELVQQNFALSEAAKKCYLKIKNKNIDVVINNAGLLPKACAFEKSSVKSQTEIFNVNFFAPYQLCQKIIPKMVKKKWGRIINISSIGVKFAGNSQTSLYTLSKMTLEGLTETINKTYAVHNILCNTLRVGVTDTDLHKTSNHKNMKERIEKIPLKRMAKTSEIANMVSFLISNEANFIAGQKIAIAGGE
jgi:3-oxoacyl-[acyl-carrier protein] reductase